jgi:HEAT repeat protein
VLGDPVAQVRRAAADALGRLGESAAVDPLASVAANDADSGVRFSALRAIALIGGEHAAETLDQLAENPKFPDTAQAIDLARREVGGFDKRGVKR